MRRLVALSIAPVLFAGLGCPRKDNPLWGLGGTQGDSDATTMGSPTTSSAPTTATAGTTVDVSSSTSASGSTGSEGPVAFGPWGPAMELPELDLPDIAEDDPSLTQDQLEMYIGGQGGPEKIYFSTRRSVVDPWGTPVVVPELDSATEDRGTPEVSPDGLVLFFHNAPINVDSLDDIWVATRTTRTAPWSNLMPATTLNSIGDEVAAAPIWSTGRLFLCSDRRDGSNRDIYEALVDLGPPLSFQTPVFVAELATDVDECSVHAAADGLTIFFESDRDNAPSVHDLWTATRPSLDEPFGAAERVDELNTAEPDRDPWLSADGRTMYFARGPDPTTIWMTTRDTL